MRNAFTCGYYDSINPTPFDYTEHIQNLPQNRVTGMISSILTIRTTFVQNLPGATRRRDCTKIAKLFADERCSQAILDFLVTLVW